jgi:hypothetical protein
MVMVAKRRKRMPCDPDDIRLLLGYKLEEIERMDQVVTKILRETKAEASAKMPARRPPSREVKR